MAKKEKWSMTNQAFACNVVNYYQIGLEFMELFLEISHSLCQLIKVWLSVMAHVRTHAITNKYLSLLFIEGKKKNVGLHYTAATSH